MQTFPLPRRILTRVSSLLNSLSLHLFLLLFGTIIVAFAVYAFVNIRSTSLHWQRTVFESAQRFSNLIQHSTHYAMLLNRKEDVHHIIRTIAREPGVERVRIYDKQGRIIFSADSAEIGSRVDLRAEACITCHAQEAPLRSVPVNSRTRIFERPRTGRVLGLINPIENSPECYNAACHAHPPDQSVLGVLDVTMSMAVPDHHLGTVKRQTVIAAVLVAVLASLFSAVFIFRVVRRPVKQLITGTELVAAGDLSTEITIDRRNEIGQLADAFNTMTRDLATAQSELQEWSNGLETKLQEKTAELSQTQRQVAHMDKMASLGKLAASVAHELNNPLAGILNYAKLVDRTLRESDTPIPEREQLERYLSLIQKEAARSGNIVRNLLIFARPVSAEFANHSINAIVKSAVTLLKHHLEISEIRLETQPIDGDDQLRCDADQLQQALVALLVNAVEAMPNGGALRVSAEHADGSVVLSIVDTGIGIPKEVMPHILEPFFSSKEQDGAVGLGLSVVYGIVQHHQGHIEVDSEVGQGTTFRITLPLHPPTKGNPTVDAVTAPGRPWTPKIGWKP